MPEIGALEPGLRPSILNWPDVADNAALAALVLAVNDNGKVAYQADAQTIKILLDSLGPTWLTMATKAYVDALGAALASSINAIVLPTAGDGIVEDEGAFNVNVDGDTLEISSDLLRVKNGGISLVKLATIATHQILARNSSGDGAVEVCTVGNILDWLSSTRGAILYRGAAGWAALDPATSGYVLTAKGTGNDPAYEAPTAIGTDYPALVPPAAISTWTKDNQSTSEMDDISGGLGHYIREVGRSNFNFRSILKAYPSPSPSKTFTAFFRISHAAAARVCCGLTMAENLSGGKFRHFSTDTGALNLWKWSSRTGYDSHNYQYTTIQRQYIWMRLVDDGTNIQAYVSENGRVWAKFGASFGRTSYFTPGYIGWHLDAGGDSNMEVVGQLLHWVES